MSSPPGPRSWSQNIRRDLPASLAVFLVALPLCLGIALASGAPILAGLIAGVVGGIVVGSMTGAPLQVTGPAAGLVVLVFDLVQRVGGDWRAACAVIALAGGFQLLLGLARVGRVALAISPAVVHGMLAGIGLLIALGQAHVMLGGTPKASAGENLASLPAGVESASLPALMLGVLTIAILIGWEKLPARLRSIPSPLVAVTAATVVSMALALPVAHIDLALEDDLLANLALPVWPDLPLWTVLGTAVVIAIVASVESLLCAVATDKMHDGRRANLDRELVAQGIGNTASGMLGGLPVTGVIVRSSTNVLAGAKTRMSAVLHGFWILVFVAFLPFVVQAVPEAVLAALLVFIGVRLVNISHAREVAKNREFVVYAVAVGGVVFIDLLSGVALGVACSIARLAWSLGKSHVEVFAAEPGNWKVRVHGPMSFLAVPRMLTALGRVPAEAAVRVDFTNSSLDHAGRDALDGWVTSYERGGGTVHVEGLRNGRRRVNTMARPEVGFANEHLEDSDLTTTQTISEVSLGR